MKSIGRLAPFLKEQELAAFPHFEAIREDIAARIAKLDAIGGLSKALKGELVPDALATQLERSMLIAKLGGHLWTATMEVEETIKLQAGGKSVFFNLPFEEAIKFFLSKKIITPAEFDQLEEQARRDSFVARKLLNDSLVRLAKTELESALEQGSSFADFSKAIREGEALAGTTPSSAGYIQTVFRTNILTAYSQGKIEQGTKPEVLEARPLWLFRAAMDARTTPSHAALHDKVFRKTGEFAQKAITPLWFNCRCSWVSISEEMAEANGYEEIEDFPMSTRTFANPEGN